MATAIDILRILGLCWLVTVMLVGGVRGAIWFARRSLDGRRLAMMGAALGSAWLVVLASWAVTDGDWWQFGHCSLLVVAMACVFVILRDQCVVGGIHVVEEVGAFGGAYEPELDLRKVDRQAKLGAVATGLAVASYSLPAMVKADYGSAVLLLLFGGYLSFHYFREHRRSERAGVDFCIRDGQLINGARRLPINDLDTDSLVVRGDKLVVRSAVDAWKDPISIPIGILTDRSRSELMAVLGGNASGIRGDV